MRRIAFFAAISVASLATGQSHAQDAAAGEKVFTKCKACHVADQDTNKVGPSLKGVIGRTAGTHPNFKYSQAMMDAGKGGLVWDEAKLTEYLKDPKAMVPGTRMEKPPGPRNDAERTALLDYLKKPH